MPLIQLASWLKSASLAGRAIGMEFCFCMEFEMVGEVFVNGRSISYRGTLEVHCKAVKGNGDESICYVQIPKTMLTSKNFKSKTELISKLRERDVCVS